MFIYLEFYTIFPRRFDFKTRCVQLAENSLFRQLLAFQIYEQDSIVLPVIARLISAVPNFVSC